MRRVDGLQSSWADYFRESPPHIGVVHRAMIRRNNGAEERWLRSAKSTRAGSVPSLTIDVFTPRPSAGPYVPPSLERAIADRWKHWVPWVRMQQLRARDYDPSLTATESARLRQRHSEHILDLMREGISMRTIQRHRLDDPRITDEVRSVLVEATRERQSKARYRRPNDQRAQDRLAMLIKLDPVVRKAAATNTGNESTEVRSPAAAVVPDPPTLRETILAIRRLVCEHFYMREMRDGAHGAHHSTCIRPSAAGRHVRSQAADGASLEEIGREFGNRHHTTVLHSVNKIEAMRHSNEALNRTIKRLMDAVVVTETRWVILAIAALRTQPWPASGWGRRGRRLF